MKRIPIFFCLRDKMREPSSKGGSLIFGFAFCQREAPVTGIITVESISQPERVPGWPVSPRSRVNPGSADFVSIRAGAVCPVMDAMAFAINGSRGSPNGSFSSGKVSEEVQMSG